MKEIATGRALISAGDENADALSRRLFPQRVIELVACGSEEGFAQAETLTHDSIKIVFDDVPGREIDAGSTVGISRNHEIDFRALRNRA